jgi:hypothetical protein
MDESALKILLSSLDVSRSSLDSWLWWATFLVVIGVGLEWIFVIWEYREELHDFRRGVIHAPEKPNIWLFVLGLVATSLVTIGVAGEMYIGAAIGDLETQIRKANELRAALLSKEAEQLRKDAEQLKKDAEGEHLARVQLQKQIQPRSLDGDSRKKIGEELSTFSSHFSGRKVTVESYAADAEGIAFSLEVMDIITSAGITVDPVIGRLEPVGLVDTGLNITGPIGDGPFIREFMNKLHKHVDTDICGEWDSKYSELSVFVAVKPIPGLPRYKSPTSTSKCSNVR